MSFSRFVFAAAAAAAISIQAAYAAPVRTAPAVDPLLSLSLLGTAQSQAAACRTATACTLPAAMATSTAAAQGNYDGGKDATLLWVLGSSVILAIVIALILSGGDGEGDLAPVSPD